MSKRQIIVIIVGVALLLAAIFGAILTNGYGLNKKKQSPLLALPDNYIFYFYGEKIADEIKHLQASNLWKNISIYQGIAKFDTKIQDIDSTLKKYDEAYKYISNNPCLLSFHRTSKNRIDPLFVISSASRFDASRIKSMIKKDKNSKFIEYSFRNINIYSLQGNETEIKLAFAFCGGLFIMSNNSGLVEDAIREVFENKNPVNKIVRKNKINHSTEKFQINFSEIPTLFSVFLNSKGSFSVKNLRNFASGYSFGIDVYDNECIARGNLPFNDSTNYFVNLFENQNAKKIDIDKVTSIKTAALIVTNLSDYSLFFEKLNKDKNHEKEILDELRKNIVPKINGQFGISLSEPIHEDLGKSVCVWIKTDEAEDLKNFFYDGKSVSIAQNISGRMYYPTSKTKVLPILFGPLYQLTNDVWFTIIRDYLVFSSNLSLLQSTTEDFLNEQTLSKSAEFAKIMDRLASESNFLFYTNPQKALILPEFYLNENWINRYKSQNFLLSIGQIAFQMTNNKNSIYAEMIIENNLSEVKSFQKIWDFEMDTMAISKPFKVINHKNNHPELLIMDASTNLYLLSNEGDLIWKKNIGSLLVGDIYMIDFYNNKKYQYLFATETHLHCIDRLGRNVANYPIRLGAKAITGIYLHQNARGGQSKYYIGTANQAIYGFDITGKPLNGWSLIRLEGNLAFEPRVLMSGTKEFIFGITQNGKLYVWDGKGNAIVNAQQTASGFYNPFFAQNGIDMNDSYITSLDSNGNTWRVFVNNKKEVQQLGKWSAQTWFLPADINKDKKSEFIYFDEKTISIYEANGKLNSSFEVIENSDFPPVIVINSDDNFIAYYNIPNSKIYCYSLGGVMVRNFPVSSSPFFAFYDLNGDGEHELTSSVGNRIFVARF